MISHLQSKTAIGEVSRPSIHRLQLSPGVGHCRKNKYSMQAAVPLVLPRTPVRSRHWGPRKYRGSTPFAVHKPVKNAYRPTTNILVSPSSSSIPATPTMKLFPILATLFLGVSACARYRACKCHDSNTGLQNDYATSEACAKYQREVAGGVSYSAAPHNQCSSNSDLGVIVCSRSAGARWECDWSVC